MKMGTTPSRCATIGKSAMLCHLALRIVDPPMLRGWSAYPSIAVISISLPDRRDGPQNETARAVERCARDAAAGPNASAEPAMDPKSTCSSVRSNADLTPLPLEAPDRGKEVNGDVFDEQGEGAQPSVDSRADRDVRGD